MANQGLSRRELRVKANRTAIKKLSLIIRKSLLIFPRAAQGQASVEFYLVLVTPKIGRKHD